MTIGRYLVGAVLLLAVIGSAGLGAVRVRQRVLPVWSGAPARLAEAVIGLGIVIGIAQLLGAIGLLRAVFVVPCCIVVGLGLATTPFRRHVADTRRSGATLIPRPALAAALLGSALVFAQWVAGVVPAFHGGMLGSDTLSYHGPLAAIFVQQASILHPTAVYADPAITSYPATAELVHALGILIFTRDLLSPLINLGWFALALLAAWCVGRPAGAGPAATLSVAAILGLPVLSTSQPGSADNDITALALLLCAVALLLNADSGAGTLRWRRRARGAGAATPTAGGLTPIPLAGVAAGLALGTTYSMGVPIALLTLAVLVLVRGWAARAAWVLPLIAGSCVWFARNLFAFGSPIPSAHIGIGSLSLHSASMPNRIAVVDLIGSHWIVHHIYLPGLHWAFTFLWPAVLSLALAGAILGALSGPTRLDRLLAPIVIAAAIAYAYTPSSADGYGAYFQFNLRYLVPAMLLGILLLVRSRALRGAFGHPASLLAPLALIGVDLWRGPSFGVVPICVGAGAVALALLLAFGSATFGRVRPHAAWASLAALALVLVLLAPAERSYLRTRYRGTSPAACGTVSCAPYLFASSLRHARIAVVGSLPPYPLYGQSLSNTVTEVVHYGPHGTQTPITSCRPWRRALASGHFGYVVTSPAFYLYGPSTTIDETAWTRSDRAWRVLSVTHGLFNETVTVFERSGAPDPASCGSGWRAGGALSSGPGERLRTGRGRR